MTVRERNLLVALCGVAGLVAVWFVFHQWFWSPLKELKGEIAALDDEVFQKENLIHRILSDKKRLEKYKVLSLASDPDQAAADYTKYLKPLLTKHGLKVELVQRQQGTARPASQTKKTTAGHMTLEFNVRARGTLAQFVNAVHDFKKAPVAHRVKSLVLSPGDDSNLFTLQMTIEALIANRADNQQPHLSNPDLSMVVLDAIAALRRGPVGLGVLPWRVDEVVGKELVKQDQLWARNYEDIRHKNIFVGAIEQRKLEFVERTPDFDMRDYVKLEHTDPVANEAFLRNHMQQIKAQRLRVQRGFDTFQVLDEEGTAVLMRGKVLRIDQRDVFFQCREDIYRFHIGQSVRDAMSKRMTTSEIRELDLTGLYDEDFAAAQAEADPPQGAKGPGKGIQLKAPQQKKGFKKR
jgi:hypothetical protein